MKLTYSEPMPGRLTVHADEALTQHLRQQGDRNFDDMSFEMHLVQQLLADHPELSIPCPWWDPYAVLRKDGRDYSYHQGWMHGGILQCILRTGEASFDALC